MAYKEVLFILVIIGVSTCTASNECPQQGRLEDVPECECYNRDHNWREDKKSLVLHCEARRTRKTFQDFRKILLEHDFASKRSITLRFSDFKSRVPSRVFEGFHIRTLWFLRNQITKWADDEGGPAFVGLEDSLEKLIFEESISRPYDNEYMKAPMSFSHLHKLSGLHFYKDDIYIIGNDWFEKGPSSLEILRISSSHIRSVGDRAFASLPNLKALDVDGNEIERVSRSMFPNPANKLQEMDFSKNKLTSLPDDMFTNMPSLTYFDISNNRITRLPEVIWRPVWSRFIMLFIQFTDLICDDHIDWIFKVKPPETLWGTCHEPKELENVKLEDLIKEKQRRN